MVNVLKDTDSGRYGGFFVVSALCVSETVGAYGERYAFMAENYGWCNCNGDIEYDILAVGDSFEELYVWAAANGLSVGIKPIGFPDKITVG